MREEIPFCVCQNITERTIVGVREGSFSRALAIGLHCETWIINHWRSYKNRLEQHVTWQEYYML